MAQMSTTIDIHLKVERMSRAFESTMINSALQEFCAVIQIRIMNVDIGCAWEESKPWWPQPTRTPADAPDIVYIALDV